MQRWIDIWWSQKLFNFNRKYLVKHELTKKVLFNHIKQGVTMFYLVRFCAYCTFALTCMTGLRICEQRSSQQILLQRRLEFWETVRAFASTLLSILYIQNWSPLRRRYHCPSKAYPLWQVKIIYYKINIFNKYFCYLRKGTTIPTVVTNFALLLSISVNMLTRETEFFLSPSVIQSRVTFTYIKRIVWMKVVHTIELM